MTIRTPTTPNLNILYINMRRYESDQPRLTGAEIKAIGHCSVLPHLYEDLAVTGHQALHGGAHSVPVGDGVSWDISGYTHHFYTLLPATYRH